jgi:hypothetical protein
MFSLTSSTNARAIQPKKGNRGSPFRRRKGELAFQKKGTPVPPTLFKESIYDLPERSSAQRQAQVSSIGIDDFWRVYPKKVARDDALRAFGIEIRAVHDGTADAIMVGIRGLIGQMQREDGAKKVRRGMAGVIRDGRHAGGRAYGYRPVPGRPGELEIVDGEAEVVRQIFAAYAGGRTPRAIAGDLNRQGCSATIWMGSRIASGRNVPERLFVASS